MLTNAEMRYLMAVYELSVDAGGGAIHSVNIAQRLGVSRASVVKMVRSLEGRGLLVKPRYGTVRLTPEGILFAGQEYARLSLLQSFFSRRLKLGLDHARHDAVACLCSLSPESVNRMIEMA